MWQEYTYRNTQVNILIFYSQARDGREGKGREGKGRREEGRKGGGGGEEEGRKGSLIDLNLGTEGHKRDSAEWCDTHAVLVGLHVSPDNLELSWWAAQPSRAMECEAGHHGMSQRCSRTYFFMGHAWRGAQPCLPAKWSVSHVVLSPVIWAGTCQSVRAVACGLHLPISVAQLNELLSWGAGRVQDPGRHVSWAGTGQGWVGSPCNAPPPPFQPPPSPTKGSVWDMRMASPWLSFSCLERFAWGAGSRRRKREWVGGEQERGTDNQSWQQPHRDGCDSGGGHA